VFLLWFTVLNAVLMQSINKREPPGEIWLWRKEELITGAVSHEKEIKRFLIYPEYGTTQTVTIILDGVYGWIALAKGSANSNSDI